MPATLTLDGFNGAAVTLTDTVFNDVSSFTVDVDKQMISFNQPDGGTRYVAIPVVAASGGFTVTVVNNKVATVTVSNT